MIFDFYPLRKLRVQTEGVFKRGLFGIYQVLKQCDRLFAVPFPCAHSRSENSAFFIENIGRGNVTYTEPDAHFPVLVQKGHEGQSLFLEKAFDLFPGLLKIDGNHDKPLVFEPQMQPFHRRHFDAA